MELRVGIFDKDSKKGTGWKTICESEALPHGYLESYEAPVILFEGPVPEGVGDFVMRGGTAVISGADHSSLPPSVDYRGEGFIEEIDFKAISVDSARTPGEANFFEGVGWGKYKPQKNQSGRSSDFFPLVQERSYGKGNILFTGVPLSRLITSEGSKVRSFSSHTPVTERVSEVDKAKVERVLIWMLREAFSTAGLPYAHYWYYPRNAPSVFNFRIDVDGEVGNNLAKISEVGKQHDLPVNFFINKSKCLGKENFLKVIDPMHVVGCHGDKHRVFDTFYENLDNVRGCERWLEDNDMRYEKGFAAPRGRWNYSLGKVLEELNIKYSSDFGLKFDGLPFFPRVGQERCTALQLPVHPFSVEKAFEYYKRGMSRQITPNEVTRYFRKVIMDKLRNNEPVLLYSHPREFGGMVETVLPRILETVDDFGIERITLEDFAGWWKKRDKLPLRVRFDKQNSSLSIDSDLSKSFKVHVISTSESTQLENTDADNVIVETR